MTLGKFFSYFSLGALTQCLFSKYIVGINNPLEVALAVLGASSLLYWIIELIRNRKEISKLEFIAKQMQFFNQEIKPFVAITHTVDFGNPLDTASKILNFDLSHASRAEVNRFVALANHFKDFNALHKKEVLTLEETDRLGHLLLKKMETLTTFQAHEYLL